MAKAKSNGALVGARCLVTGGGGFLGQALTRALVARGCTVHVLDREPAPSDLPPEVRWCRGDIRDGEDVRRAMEGTDTVFHTAALIETAERAPSEVVELVESVNVGGTKTVLDAAVALGVRRLVHTSSTHVTYGKETVGADESGPYSESPNLYSITKVAAERLVLEANGRGALLTCAIRPGGIYGPGERKLIVGPMLRAVKRGAPIVIFGNGSSRLDFTYIDNAVDGQLRAADRLVDASAVAGRAYFITDDQPVNPGALTIGVARAMGLATPVVRVPRRVAMALASASELAYERFGTPPQVTRCSVALCCQDNYFSIAKARTDLGYEPLVDTSEGIRRAAREAARYYGTL
ncbi:MAG: NAD-dependent epimerase/dehydratase family protein [Myxococcales bacterium]|nr:NAD-dependent epimerase/dehydratase family protein [Myxococcales bacterium]